MSDKKIIYGKFEFKKKKYSFFLEGQMVTVNQVPYEYNEDFNSTESIEKIVGLTNNNKYITFLDCNFLGGNYRKIYSNVVFTIKGYVLFDNKEDIFDCISFSAKALNTFYSPQYAIKHEKMDFNREFDGSYQLNILPSNEYKQVFNCIIDNEEITNELKVNWNINLRYEESNLGNIFTVFLMKFQSNKSSEQLSKYYLYMYDFLTFILFRQNHIIDNIILYKKNNKIGVAKFFQKEENLKYNVFKSISFNDIGIDHIGKLFANVAEKRLLNELNPFFTPEDDRDSNSVDSVKWLSTALSFEGEFTKIYSNYKAKKSEFFKSTKEELLKLIKDKAKGTTNWNDVDSLYNMIQKSDTSIREKFQIMIDKYDSIIVDIKSSYLNQMMISDEVNLSKRYAEYRNSIAHGTIISIKNEDKVTFVLARVFIYILILESADIPHEVIKSVIDKLFI